MFLRLTVQSLLIIILSFITSGACAETGPLGFGNEALEKEMETDRPDFAEATSTVEAGHVQIEMGYSFSTNRENDSREHGGPETLLRFGLPGETELRFEWGGYRNIQYDGNTIEEKDIAGGSDLAVGMKHEMYQQSANFPALSFILDMSLPIGAKELTADEVEPAFKFLLAYDLTDRLSLASNLNFTAPYDEDRYFKPEVSLALATSISEEVGAYLEFIGGYPGNGASSTKPENQIDGGFTWSLNPNLQFDTFAGFALSENAEDFFCGVGVSTRI